LKSLEAKMPWCEIQTADVVVIESPNPYFPIDNDKTLLADPPFNPQ
jgi:hypothetical protein